MSVVVTNCYSKPTTNSVNLAVTQSGMDITVAAGPFVCGGASYTLALEEKQTIPTSDDDYHVWGYLVLDKPASKGALLLDRFKVGSSGFDFSGQTRYKCLHGLFYVLVPAGATTLDNKNVNVTHIVDFPGAAS